MDVLDKINEIGNKLTKDINLEKIQEDFLNSTFGKITNAAIDIGLKSILPDFMENEVIEVKNSFITGGLEEGIESTIKNTVEVGKKALGLTNAFEDLEQVKESFKNGNLIQGISDVLDITVNSLEDKEIISKEVSTIIKSGKDILVDSIKKGVNNEFLNEKKAIEKIEKYTENWMKYYKNKNLDGLTNEFNKIQKQLKKVLPLENIVNNFNKMININELIKNTDNFDFSEVYLSLAENLN